MINLGEEECERGFKFLYVILKFNDFRYFKIFLCKYQEEDLNRPKVYTNMEKLG